MTCDRLICSTRDFRVQLQAKVVAVLFGTYPNTLLPFQGGVGGES